MSKDFLKTNTPEVWTREQARTELFTMLETQLFKYEAEDNYTGCLKMARMILRLQMEVMEEKQETPEGKQTVYGKETKTFQTQKDKLNRLERIYQQTNVNVVDPASKANLQRQRHAIIEEIRNLLDDIFHNNTILGLNYRKKNDPMKAAYS